MKAVCTSCGRLQDYEGDSDKLDRRCLCHKVSAPFPRIADIVEADFRTCARVGHAGPGPVCTRCGEVTEDEPA